MEAVLTTMTTGEALVDNVTASSCERLSSAGTITLGVVLYLISIITIAGNILVITSFSIEKSLRSFGNYFIVNLSIADLIIGVLMAFYIPYFLTGCWTLTRPGCIAFQVLDYAVPLASTWNIALISVDRYWSVIHALEYRVKMTTRRAMLLMTVPWLIGFSFYAPSVIGWEHWTGVQQVPDDQCYVEFFNNVPYLISNSVLEFIIPFVLVLTINLLIYINIRRRSRQALGMTANSSTSSSSSTNTLSRDRKTARALAILVGIFLLTWAPYSFSALVNPICDFCIPSLWFDIVFWLLWINSTINPLIYALLQIKFRNTFLRIITCGRKSRNTVRPVNKFSPNTVSS